MPLASALSTPDQWQVPLLSAAARYLGQSARHAAVVAEPFAAAAAAAAWQ